MWVRTCSLVTVVCCTASIIIAARRSRRHQSASDPSIVSLLSVSDPWTIDEVLASLPSGKPEEGSSLPIPFFHVLERLKTTKRAGWKRYGINHGESIADHMYRMSLMAMFPPEVLRPQLDLHRSMKMCLIHDMAESLVGDLTPADKVPRTEKSRRESVSMEYITQRLLGQCAPNDILAIWQEHEDGKTIESRYVQDLDKIELLLQMVEYEKRGGGRVDLSEFTYVATKVVLPEMMVWVQEILDERNLFWSKSGLVADQAGRQSDTGNVSPKMKDMQDEYYNGEV